MKIFKKCAFLSSVGAALVGVLLAGQAHATTWVLSGDMDPIQATTNPGNVGNGTGTIAGDYDDVTNLLNYTITWMNLTSTVNNMHFHLGAPGVPGGIDLGIPSPFTSPKTGINILLTEVQETNLLSGNWYVNVHTTNFGAGEIRGQVLVEAIPVPAAVWLFGSGLIALVGLARRRPG